MLPGIYILRPGQNIQLPYVKIDDFSKIIYAIPKCDPWLPEETYRWQFLPMINLQHLPSDFDKIWKRFYRKNLPN
jgi:hypothetical protein